MTDCMNFLAESQYRHIQPCDATATPT